MKQKIVSIFVFLTLVFSTFAIFLPNVTAQDGDFEISVYPSSQTVNPGGSATFLVTVTSIDGFNSEVTLSATELPDGVTASFDPNPVTPTDNSLLTITATDPGPTGSLPITVTGTSGDLSHSTATVITVDFGLVPKQFGTFTGQVTEAETGEPIAGANVFVCDLYTYYIESGSRTLDTEPPGIPEVTTDDDGYYTIIVPLGNNNAPRDWLVGFYADGYSLTYHAATAIADTIITVDMALCHASITGQVVDVDTGEPIPGAQVSAASYLPYSTVLVGYFTTDEEGFYTLPNLALYYDNEPLGYSVVVSASGYCYAEQDTAIYCGDTTLDFSLCPALSGTFEGHVTDADTGEQIAGATVFLITYYFYDLYPNSVYWYNWYDIVPEVTTDENGYYTITDVPLFHCNAPMGYAVGFYADGYSLTYHVATAEADTISTVDMALCHADIIGTVTDANTGLPIPGANITAWSNTPASAVQTRLFVTDDLGSYTIPNLPLNNDNEPRAYNVEASAPGYCSQRQETVISCGDTTLVFSLVPRLFGTFTGQVTDAETGEPIAGATVYVYNPHNYYIYPDHRTWTMTVVPEVTTDDEGYYTITGIPLAANNAPFDWNVCFHADGYSSTYHPATAVADTITTVDMALCHASITGRVIDANTGEPIPGATISAWSWGANSDVQAYYFTTDEQGVYTLPNFPLYLDNEPRDYYVKASAPGYCDQTKYGTIFCGGIINIDFAGPEIDSGTITGTVTDCITGLPIPQAFIGSTFGGATLTNEEGIYILTNVPLESDGSPKTWHVTAMADGYEDETQSVEVSADEVSILDFILCMPYTNQPPVADAGPDQTLEQNSYAGTEVILDGSGSYDSDGDPLTYDWTWAGGSAIGVSPTVIFPLGTTTVTLTVSDGTLTDSDTVDITVEDTTPPEITQSGDQIILWPPNHKYVNISISDFILSVTDICDANVGIDNVIITLVSSDEPENEIGEGDGDTWDDIVIINATAVKLRAERDDSLNGRVYTINFQVTDLSGNTAIGVCKIWVIKSQGPPWYPAVDDGASAGYTVYYP